MMYDLNDISLHSEVSASQLEGAVNALKADNGLKGLGEYFIKAESDYNINAIVLMAIACLESAYGTSRLAKEKNNLFGIDARDSLQGTSAYGRDFESLSACIDYAGHRLGCQYLEKDENASWRYCNGKKDIWSVGMKWCSKADWGDKIADICRRIADNLSSDTEEVVDWKAKYESLVADIEELINRYKEEM